MSLDAPADLGRGRPHGAMASAGGGPAMRALRGLFSGLSSMFSAVDLDALQEWDYLHADETTDAERRTLTAWALAAGIFGAPDPAPHPKY